MRTVDKFAGLIILAVVLYWVFRDSAGTIGILQAAGTGNTQFFSALRGGGYSTGVYQTTP